MKTIFVKAKFIEDVLGSAPNNKDIYRDYIASKAPDAQTIEEEVDAVGVDAVAEKGTTVFSRDEDGNPYIYDYQIKGFFKSACGFLRNATGMKSAAIKAYKKKIDGLVFVKPRQIILQVPEELRKSDVDICERPLRAETAQGSRVALASSESYPAGTTIEFEVNCLNDGDVEYVREWLDYGQYNGIGQWRNSGKGRFVWEEIECY